MSPAFKHSRMIAEGSAALLEAVLREHPERGEVQAVPKLSVRGLIAHAARLSGVPIEVIESPSRRRSLVDLRRAVALAGRQVLGPDGEAVLSFPMIGRAMGGRDHSTVIHYCATGEALAARKPAFAWFSERVFAHGECEPLGPARAPMGALPGHVVAPFVREDYAEPEPARVMAAPAAPEPEWRPGEYVSRHALPLGPANLGLGEMPEPPADVELSRRAAAWGSAALLKALRRAHPERFDRCRPTAPLLEARA